MLRLDELPAGFGVLTAHAVTNAVAAAEDGRPRSLYARWGRRTGYEVDFGRDVVLGETPSGPISIASIANLYRTPHGAALSLAASRAVCGKAPFRPLAVHAAIGDGAVLCSAARPDQGATIELYSVTWRHGDVKLTVMAAGVRSHVSAADAIRLAQRLDRRLWPASPLAA